MPRKVYRRRYKRAGSRKAYKFSRFNLYRKRSSKSQAYQISKLNSKLNQTIKTLSPPTRKLTGNLNNQVGWGAGLVQATPISKTNPAYDMTIFPPQQNVGQCYYHGCKIHVDMEFDVPVSTYSAASNPTSTVIARFILVQYKAKQTGVTWADLLTNNTVKSGVFEPLDIGVRTKYKILKDFRKTISQRVPARHFDITYNRRFKVKKTDGNGVEKNQIALMVIAYNDGADADAIATYSVNNQAHIFLTSYNYVSYDLPAAPGNNVEPQN